VRKMEHTKTGYRGKEIPNLDLVISQCGEMWGPKSLRMTVDGKQAQGTDMIGIHGYGME
jgi:hypothetical protein